MFFRPIYRRFGASHLRCGPRLPRGVAAYSRARTALPPATSEVTTPGDHHTIHIFGLKTFSLYVAHRLKIAYKFKTITLLYRKSNIDKGDNNTLKTMMATNKIRYITRDDHVETSYGFKPEMMLQGHGERIKYLIVVVDRLGSNFSATAVLHDLKHRLDSTSTVLILNDSNRLITIDDVSTTIFPPPKLRPALWVGRCHAKIETHPRDMSRSITLYNHRDTRNARKPDLSVGPCRVSRGQDLAVTNGFRQLLQQG